ncbi:helix-turn-helix domain-containing protein [Pseudanabaena mucicola]|uniref:Helix-turn-helix domain-containing protein n=1 Tax=Pseudanabaena mucicola FACHB-723 TaxID=2692860 RepID=A0ABR7ZWF2_9CYAN|nr:helix-turn-helix domain-containing protein [Pseudanabaena mucicola]MBD2188288.1 helix-turn-helix domain-containing protein [Pseudanabaena mucicola FACHB-723]
MPSQQTITVLVQDSANKDLVSHSKSVQVLHPSDSQDLESALNLFVLASATGLPEIADIVRSANQKHHLRVLFIREDINPTWMPQMFDRANLRVMRNTLVHASSVVPQRVMNAWTMGAQEQLIADATVIGEQLLILSCAMEKLEVPFESLPALKCISANDRSSFTIDDDGSCLYWEDADIHLDLEALRCANDPEWKRKFESLKTEHNQVFGRAIANLRKQHKLRQSDIIGLSDRQVRRIEQGETSTKVDTLRLFAKAHGMDLDAYLDAVAGAIANLQTELA